jgi:3-oxoadipate enol-lactonase
MPTIQIAGGRMHYEVHGIGPETIVFAHGMLWDRHLFDAQISALQGRYRCVSFDFRGHGLSAAGRSGYELYSQTDDVAALIAALGGGPCHFVGHSMGGFVGLRLAVRHLALVKSLTLIGSAAEAPSWRDLVEAWVIRVIVRYFGLRPLANTAMDICFGDKFLADPARETLRRRMRQRLIANDRVAMARTVSALIARDDLSHKLHQITTPTLILVGSNDKDSHTTPAHSQRMHESIPGSRWVVVPGGGHTLPIEEPGMVTAALEEFLTSTQEGAIT